MVKFLLTLIAANFMMLATGWADSNLDADRNDRKHIHTYRMDCRFYNQHHARPRYCVSDATYRVFFKSPSEYVIFDVKYGVSCERQTIYANDGVPFSTTEPTLTTEDHIRPNTSDVPKTVLSKQGALVHEGTYASELYLDSTRLLDGSCDVIKYR